ncbi:hypothetical protein [Glycomyces terrestris]|uniref:hypothetical protein n=1 Tax=Glycomyces terrestris TaxID=2493553 RepID=UPI00131582F1|nr:hypothetical protein [Glycomyces terrestris]
MIDVRLLKLFAWAIGVLLLLWMLTECLGGSDEADPRNQDLERDTERYAADCDRAWQALDLVGQADGASLDEVVDQMEALGTEIQDPALKTLAAAYALDVQDLVAGTDPADLDRARAEYQDTAAFNLALRCPID